MTSGARSGRRIRQCLMALAGIALAGCATGVSTSDDLRIVVKPSGLYVMTRSPGTARSVCLAAGLDPDARDRRMFADSRGAFLTDAPVVAGLPGCQGEIRNVIVCAEGDRRCLSHEERHAREGAFHE